MLDSIRVLEFYCSIGMSGQLICILYCECMEQCQKQHVHCPCFLIGTNLLVLYTQQTMVPALQFFVSTLLSIVWGEAFEQ